MILKSRISLAQTLGALVLGCEVKRSNLEWRRRPEPRLAGTKGILVAPYFRILGLFLKNLQMSTKDDLVYNLVLFYGF